MSNRCRGRGEPGKIDDTKDSVLFARGPVLGGAEVVLDRVDVCMSNKTFASRGSIRAHKWISWIVARLWDQNNLPLTTFNCRSFEFNVMSKLLFLIPFLFRDLRPFHV